VRLQRPTMNSVKHPGGFSPALYGRTA